MGLCTVSNIVHKLFVRFKVRQKENLQFVSQDDWADWERDRQKGEIWCFAFDLQDLLHAVKRSAVLHLWSQTGTVNKMLYIQNISISFSDVIFLAGCFVWCSVIWEEKMRIIKDKEDFLSCHIHKDASTWSCSCWKTRLLVSSVLLFGSGLVLQMWTKATSHKRWDVKVTWQWVRGFQAIHPF